MRTPPGLDREGLPIGLQIMVASFKEANILGAGHAVERKSRQTRFTHHAK